MDGGGWCGMRCCLGSEVCPVSVKLVQGELSHHAWEENKAVSTHSVISLIGPTTFSDRHTGRNCDWSLMEGIG